MAFAVHSKVAFGFFGGECFVGEGDLVNPAPPPQQVDEGGFAAEDKSDDGKDSMDDTSRSWSAAGDATASSTSGSRSFSRAASGGRAGRPTPAVRQSFSVSDEVTRQGQRGERG